MHSGDTWKRVGEDNRVPWEYSKRDVCRGDVNDYRIPKETAEGRREGRRREECYVGSDAKECVIRSQTKAAVEDKETQEKWTGLLEKGGFISSFYYITIYPSPGCLK